MSTGNNLLTLTYKPNNSFIDIPTSIAWTDQCGIISGFAASNNLIIFDTETVLFFIYLSIWRAK